MNANEYQTDAMRTVKPGLTPHKLLVNGVMGICGEAGECIEIVKKYDFQDAPELDFEHLAKELGDVAYYIAVSAAAIGYTLDEILEMNIEKRKKRYPNGFDAERSNHRAEGDI